LLTVVDFDARMASNKESKTWMRGTSPRMTVEPVAR